MSLNIRKGLAKALLDGVTYKQAAEILGLPQRTVAAWWRSPDARQLAIEAARPVPPPPELEAARQALSEAAQAAKAIIAECQRDPKPASAYALQMAATVIRMEIQAREGQYTQATTEALHVEVLQSTRPLIAQLMAAKTRSQPDNDSAEAPPDVAGKSAAEPEQPPSPS
ncbi:MAG: hypothetical protein C5B50_19870 [Verrucomicrobia bacterium]|nr:MAG: hypothetical protein C5B50_19870 [Verrucomicrobiota bacterium]